MTEGAVDVDESVALPADEMMVVVAHPVFVASGRTGRLDAADDSVLGQNPERVVHRLTRHRADVGRDHLEHHISRCVRMAANCRHDRQSLRSDAEPVLTQNLSWIRGVCRGHGTTIAINLE